MSLRKKEFLIIIPVYNEKKHIKQVINNVYKNIDFQSIDLLVINDGSTDKTSGILARFDNIIVITHSQNKGYGQSLMDGFQYAIKNQYKYALTMDCDQQHEPYEIINFIQEISHDKYDIVSGSRYLNINSEQIKTVPQDRFKINKKITEKINKLTKYNLTDSFCGFKAYKVCSLEKLRLTEPGYGFPLQLWLQAHKKKLKIKEIPVKLIYLDYTRNFSNNFISIIQRYRYYLKIIEREVEK